MHSFVVIATYECIEKSMIERILLFESLIFENLMVVSIYVSSNLNILMSLLFSSLY